MKISFRKLLSDVKVDAVLASTDDKLSERVIIRKESDGGEEVVDWLDTDALKQGREGIPESYDVMESLFRYNLSDFGSLGKAFELLATAIHEKGREYERNLLSKPTSPEYYYLVREGYYDDSTYQQMPPTFIPLGYFESDGDARREAAKSLFRIFLI